ncbi:hypothetical protein CTZ27_09930 [Streptomyces griseocarneus]|nr:hypothetical protein CTZ27_09930 [Streptomyces griseocarneus]
MSDQGNSQESHRRRSARVLLVDETDRVLLLKYHAGHRWWTQEEPAASGETVFPFGLAGLVARPAAGRVPAEPVRLPWQH